MTKFQILLIARIIEACDRSEKITLYDPKTDIEYTGVARHIVEPDSYGFPGRITADCRLRVTSTTDMFFPLEYMTDYTDAEDGLWITYERPQP